MKKASLSSVTIVLSLLGCLSVAHADEKNRVLPTHYQPDPPTKVILVKPRRYQPDPPTKVWPKDLPPRSLVFGQTFGESMVGSFNHDPRHPSSGELNRSPFKTKPQRSPAGLIVGALAGTLGGAVGGGVTYFVLTKDSAAVNTSRLVKLAATGSADEGAIRETSKLTADVASH